MGLLVIFNAIALAAAVALIVAYRRSTDMAGEYHAMATAAEVGGPPAGNDPSAPGSETLVFAVIGSSDTPVDEAVGSALRKEALANVVTVHSSPERMVLEVDEACAAMFKDECASVLSEQGFEPIQSTGILYRRGQDRVRIVVRANDALHRSPLARSLWIRQIEAGDPAD